MEEVESNRKYFFLIKDTYLILFLFFRAEFSAVLMVTNQFSAPEFLVVGVSLLEQSALSLLVCVHHVQ